MKKVLIIEDDLAIAELYNIVFTKRGYASHVAFNGEEGIQALTNFTPDIILVDVMMPKMNGMQVLQRLKADLHYKNIPVMVLSNLTDTTTEQSMLQEGAVKFVVKSQKLPDDIVDIVEEFFTSAS